MLVHLYYAQYQRMRLIIAGRGIAREVLIKSIVSIRLPIVALFSFFSAQKVRVALCIPWRSEVGPSLRLQYM